MSNGMTTISDIQYIHWTNTQFWREIHAILPREDATGGAEVLAAPPQMPKAVPRNREEKFEDKEIVKGNELRMVFNRVFEEMYETI